MQINYYPAS
ncbi:uncharacterized protein FFFS_16043 [Fusarium fujikuroi]|nr:uncharacterized protein FFFS_16043 [Fusarium fujikuroi]